MEITVIIALTTGLVEMFKGIGLKDKLAPIAALISATSLVALTGYCTMPVSEIIVTGLICGLSACGLYSGAKTLMEKEGNK